MDTEAAVDAAEAEANNPTTPPTPTLADRFVGMADLISGVRTRTRLSEATLAKTLEIALQYHAWQAQVDQQTAQNQFQQMLRNNGIGGEEDADADESLVGPTPNEIIRAVEDSGPVISGGIGEVINPDDPRHPNYVAPVLALVE